MIEPNQEWTYVHKCLRYIILGGSPGLVVVGGDHVPKVVSLNPNTVYWMDIFSHLFVVKIII